MFVASDVANRRTDIFTFGLNSSLSHLLIMPAAVKWRIILSKHFYEKSRIIRFNINKAV